MVDFPSGNKGDSRQSRAPNYSPAPTPSFPKGKLGDSRQSYRYGGGGSSSSSSRAKQTAARQQKENAARQKEIDAEKARQAKIKAAQEAEKVRQTKIKTAQKAALERERNAIAEIIARNPNSAYSKSSIKRVRNIDNYLGKEPVQNFSPAPIKKKIIVQSDTDKFQALLGRAYTPMPKENNFEDLNFFGKAAADTLGITKDKYIKSDGIHKDIVENIVDTTADQLYLYRDFLQDAISVERESPILHDLLPQSGNKNNNLNFDLRIEPYRELDYKKNFGTAKRNYKEFITKPSTVTVGTDVALTLFTAGTGNIARVGRATLAAGFLGASGYKATKGTNELLKGDSNKAAKEYSDSILFALGGTAEAVFTIKDFKTGLRQSRQARSYKNLENNAFDINTEYSEIYPEIYPIYDVNKAIRTSLDFDTALDPFAIQPSGQQKRLVAKQFDQYNEIINIYHQENKIIDINSKKLQQQDILKDFFDSSFQVERLQKASRLDPKALKDLSFENPELLNEILISKGQTTFERIDNLPTTRRSIQKQDPIQTFLDDPTFKAEYQPKYKSTSKNRFLFGSDKKGQARMQGEILTDAFRKEFKKRAPKFRRNADNILDSFIHDKSTITRTMPFDINFLPTDINKSKDKNKASPVLTIANMFDLSTDIYHINKPDTDIIADQSFVFDSYYKQDTDLDSPIDFPTKPRYKPPNDPDKIKDPDLLNFLDLDSSIKKNKKSNTKPNQGYIGQVKEKGKWLNTHKKSLPKNKALNIAANIADNSTARSIRLTKKGITKDGDDIFLYSGKFRPPKRKNSKVLIEKTAFAIDSQGEIKGLSAAKLISQRSKKREGNAIFKF